MAQRASAMWLLALSLAPAAIPPPAAAQGVQQPARFDPAIEQEFIEGMTSYAARDYPHAEASFRRILDRNPELLRVRLELARTVFMQKKDEQGD